MRELLFSLGILVLYNSQKIISTMPGWELIIGCVGKPSAGKSTFFNAVTDSVAKVGLLFRFHVISRSEIIHSRLLNQIQVFLTT